MAEQRNSRNPPPVATSNHGRIRPVPNPLWQAKRVLGGDVASAAIDSIYDHSPLLYVRCLRQYFIAG